MASVSKKFTKTGQIQYMYSEDSCGGYPPVCSWAEVLVRIAYFMIGANGSVRGKKEFEPSSLAAESKPLLGPHLEDYWSRRGLLGPLWRTIGLIGPFHLGRSVSTLSPYHGRLGREGGIKMSEERVSVVGRWGLQVCVGGLSTHE